MRKLFCLVSIYVAPFIAFAGNITGYVRNEKAIALSGVSILLMQRTDSSVVSTAISDNSGRYEIVAPARGTFLLKAQMVGYEPHYELILEATAVMPGIVLKPLKNPLIEVTVRGSKPLIEAFTDKIVMNVASSISASGSTAFEVLQHAPGVAVDGNDNISLKGKQGIAIMIDGKIQPLQGADLATILKGMPATAIDKIEIISNPGARYDAAGTGGIINIRMKKERRMGINGSFNAGYGQGIYPKENAGASLNFRSQKLALYATYNYTQRKGLNNLDLLRRFYDSGMADVTYKQYDEMLLRIQSHTVSCGADYTFSPKTALGVAFTGGSNGFDLTGSNQTMVMDATDKPASSFATQRANNNHWSNAGVNINLRQRLDSAGSELTADADYAHYANTSEQNLKTTYRLPDGTQQLPDYLLFGTLDGYTDIRSLKADYTKSIRKTVRLEAGAKWSLVRADNSPAFYNRSAGGNTYDSGKSNHFIYDENINAAYLNTAKEGVKWNIQAGLRAEQTITKGHQVINNETFDRNYFQLFPSIAVTRHLDTLNDLGLSISRHIERPNYQQLNPFRRYLDVSSVNQGNPYLLPALTWSAELTHTWKARFVTQFSWSRSTDVITQVIQPEGAQKTIVTDQNLSTNTNYVASGTYPLTPFKWWNVSLHFDAWYSSYEGNIAATPLNAGAASADISAQNTFTLPRDWSGELMGSYQTGQRYGYMQLRPNCVISIGVQKSFWKGAATLRLSAADLLWNQNPVGTSEFAQYHEDFIVMRDSRVANLAVTFRFGKRSNPQSGKRQRGADEELRRAGGDSAG